MDSCLLCNRIALIKKGQNKNFIKEYSTGYLVLEDYQFYHGYCIFIAKKHVNELHELGDERYLFLKEMAQIAEQLFLLFKPEKLNYELLGNSEKHVHWHLIPRYKDDPYPHAPIWVIDSSIRHQAKKLSTESRIYTIQLINSVLTH